MFHNLTIPKHNTKVATPISPIHATCATVPKRRNPTINVVQTSPYGIPFNLGTYDVSPNVSPTTNHTHCSPKTFHREERFFASNSRYQCSTQYTSKGSNFRICTMHANACFIIFRWLYYQQRKNGKYMNEKKNQQSLKIYGGSF
jgi:hypothetical protein